MKENLIIRLAARCEAAGRPNNEDNYQISEDLATGSWGFTADKTLDLGDKGALLVVCDGMGGMNAGEVASAIAVDTIKKAFAKEFITEKVLASSSAIRHFITEAIQAADAAIKEEGHLNPEHEGMGSTIVLVWMLGAKAYVGWCGDSRAYRYNPANGLERLSHDHSYVQELVDAGKLTEELAFDHPNNNIITRSLGDPRGKARPDTQEYDLYKDDILLLCSDGLCGCLRDNEIEAVMAQHRTSLQECRDALWEADEAAGWHDNVTIVLAQVMSGAAVMSPQSKPQLQITAEPTVQPAAAIDGNAAALQRRNKNLKIALGGIIVILLLGLAYLGYNMWKYQMVKETPVPTADSTLIEPEIPAEENPAVEPADTPIDKPTDAPAVKPVARPATGTEPAQPERHEDQDVQVKTVPVVSEPPVAPAAPEAPVTPAAPAATEVPVSTPAPAPLHIGDSSDVKS
ncbi:MAG: serine/threonine-protein phosphatase [Paludibacteraceae bacterium]|nr:serine/threonine-protein phosphatase [Paludibacteraceae bacterium]MBQ5379205.1 serine/threonine-protein phosphatase [Paludibacteraceae bacterium]